MSYENLVKVGMADMKMGKDSDILTTLGLGSCVGVILHERNLKIAALAHVMLPDSTQIKNNGNIYKFADTAIYQMIKELEEAGVNKSNLIAKIAGGAHMFEFKNQDPTTRIGTRNVSAVIEILNDNKIPIKAQDTGSNYGRTVEFCIDTGILKIKTVGHGIKEI